MLKKIEDENELKSTKKKDLGEIFLGMKYQNLGSLERISKVVPDCYYFEKMISPFQGLT
ncbi:hypothetical protein [Lacihabitans sp. LS3-19]|uniref:hypothetical protein n=1 Tax=Lacihabitans sp. LS3-19 TaxID=2487335 RepID=UPI0020CE9D43|nr:hypothetical protein [Lacihabitans sp. LS3-19]